MGLYVEGDVPYVTGNNCYGNNSGFGLGNGWEGIIALLVIAGLFGGGWGFGGFGGNRGGSPATQADLSAGFANSEIMSDLNDIILGQATMQNFINQGFAGLNNTINTGFAGVNNAICTLGYQNQAGFNAISREIADCCCKTNANIQEVNYNMAKNTCDIIRANQDNTRAILDFLTNEKIEGLRAENTSLKGQISNDKQTQNILENLRSGCPIPAFLTCNPNAPYGFGYGFPFGYGNYGNTGCCGASVL